MPWRYTCDKRGLENNWVEISDDWSYEERDAFLSTQTDEEIVAWANQTIGDCHIELKNGDVITRGADLTMDKLRRAQIRISKFIALALVYASRDMGNLGNVSARLSLDGQDEKAPQTIAAPQE